MGRVSGWQIGGGGGFPAPTSLPSPLPVPLADGWQEKIPALPMLFGEPANRPSPPFFAPKTRRCSLRSVERVQGNGPHFSGIDTWGSDAPNKAFNCLNACSGDRVRISQPHSTQQMQFQPETLRATVSSLRRTPSLESTAHPVCWNWKRHPREYTGSRLAFPRLTALVATLDDRIDKVSQLSSCANAWGKFITCERPFPNDHRQEFAALVMIRCDGLNLDCSCR